MNVTNAPSDYARGFGAFSVKVTKLGASTLQGVLPDGTAVAASGKIIIGDSDTYCLPISVDGRKGGFGCCLWFKDGWLFNVSDIRAWNSTGKREFKAGWRAIYSSLPGSGEFGEEYELVMADVPETMGGRPLVVDPNGDSVQIKGNRWTGTDDSKFRVTLNAKSGLLSGSMSFYVETRNGKVQSKPCKVSGVLVDGTAYCSALSSRDGSYAV